jgi:hypothetical protein
MYEWRHLQRRHDRLSEPSGARPTGLVHGLRHQVTERSRG